MKSLTEKELITKRSYDKNAKAWSDAHLDRGFWVKEMSIFHKLLPRGRLLEVGCGGGRDARELIELGYDYFGTDISSGLINEARKNNPGAEFQQTSLYGLAFSDKFDGFWCAAVLLHVPKARIEEALSAIVKNMKQGSFGFITIKEGKGERIEKESESARLFSYWQDSDFIKTLKKSGLEVIYKQYRPMTPKTRWLVYWVKVL